MSRGPGTGTVGRMIRLDRFRRVASLLAVALLTVTPAASTLLSAPAEIEPADPVDLGNVEARYAASRRALLDAGAAYRDWTGQFLQFDPGGDGRVVQVFGDLPAADRIAVLVPGAGNRAWNFQRGVGGKQYRSPAVQAAELYRAARGAGGFAVVAWLGYDAPDGLDATALREDLARAGAAALERFVAGLLALRPHATVALLGHSYGGVVVGLAAPSLSPRVTDLAVFGCPGMGVERAADLGTTARVWAGLSGRDPVRWMPGVRLFGLGHGRRPTDPDFGAHIFGTADVSGHDHYLAPGTDSLADLARIALGRS
jgi:hypothetical protein